MYASSLSFKQFMISASNYEKCCSEKQPLWPFRTEWYMCVCVCFCGCMYGFAHGVSLNLQLSSCMIQVWTSIGKFFRSMGHDRVNVNLKVKRRDRTREFKRLNVIHIIKKHLS